MAKLTRTRMNVPLTFDRIEERPAHAFCVQDATGTVLLALVKCHGGFNLTHWRTGRVLEKCTSHGKPVTLQEAFQGTLETFKLGAYTARMIEQSAAGLVSVNKNADHPQAPAPAAPLCVLPAQRKAQPKPKAPAPVQLGMGF